MSQPQWKLVQATDTTAIFTDETGVYDPELEIIEEVNDAPEAGRFLVFRVCLDGLKLVEEGGKSYLVNDAWDETWGHPSGRTEWFDDDMLAIANCNGTTVDELITAFCSADPINRAWAFQSVANYHGLESFDSYPLTMSEEEVDERIKTRWI